jgi:hypothetical protein
MMNVPTDIASKVVDSMKATPFVMALLILNTIALGGFSYGLHQISAAAERRDTILDKCMSLQLKP